jgi:ribokinase
MIPRITVLGSSNTDMIVKLPTLPGPGETVIGGTFSMAAGGKGANQAVAAARAGGKVTFISRVGDDTFGKQSVAGFALEGLETSHVGVDPGAASGIALILVDQAGENSIGVASGANAEISISDIENSLDVIRSSDIFLTQLEIPPKAVEAAIAEAHRAGVPVVLNPAPAHPLRTEILSEVTVLTPNEKEAGHLTGITIGDEAGTIHAARTLLNRGVHSIIVTLGGRGAYIADPTHGEFIPAFRVQAIDTTAAGDVFSGALAVALAEKASLREAALFASAAAALSVTKLGAQPSAPLRAEIESFLQQNA